MSGDKDPLQTNIEHMPNAGKNTKQIAQVKKATNVSGVTCSCAMQHEAHSRM
jgi:hypothetical protein